MKFLLSTLFIFSTYIVLSQPIDDYNNQLKYWFHRWRLTNDFMKMGTQQGDGCIFSDRNKDNFNGKHIKAGDQPYYLGYYIGVLATEYALLSQNQRWEDLERTKTELYYALKTYERLDNNAEQIFPFDANNPNQIPSIPGYFVRDDIPPDYFLPSNDPDNRHHFNQPWTTFPGSGIIKYHESDFSTAPDTDTLGIINADKTHNSPSGDQYTLMLMGFRLVAKSLPNWNIPVKLLDSTAVNFNFVQEAVNHTTNMLNWLAYGGAISELYTTAGSADNPTIPWFVYMPDHTFSAPGAHAAWCSFPLAQAGNFICGYNTTAPYLGIPVGFHDAMTIGDNPLWTAQIPVVTPNSTGAFDTRALQCVQAAITNSWVVLGANLTEEALLDKCMASGWVGFYPMLWAYCNDKVLDDDYRSAAYQAAKDDMTEVPCYGINSLSGLYKPGWAIGMKWNRSPAEQNDPNASTVTKGFHNGLDFMLQHNLYYLTNDNPLPEYTNFINFYTKHDFYSQNGQFTQYWTESFNRMNVNVNVGPLTDVTFRAGYEVHVTPGFHAHHNSHVRIYTDPHECALGDDNYKMDKNGNEITAYGYHKLPVENILHRATLPNAHEPSFNDSLISFESPNQVENLRIYPNPSDGLVIVEYQENIEEQRAIYVSNALGQRIQPTIENIQNFIRVDLSGYPPGMYNITIQLESEIITKKIIKL